MQDIDNNMDELFRKAGESYPLKTDADGWDKIAPMLLETPAVSHIPNKKNNLKKYTILIILLLAFFLFGTLTSRYIWKKDTGIASKFINTKLPVKDAATNGLQTNLTASQKQITATKTSKRVQMIDKGARITTTFIMPTVNEILTSEAIYKSEEANKTAETETTQQSKLTQHIKGVNIEKHDWPAADVLKKNKVTLITNLPTPAATNDTLINNQTKKVKTNPT